MMRAICAVLLLLVAGGAYAHKPSDSYLSLRSADDAVEGQWDIALRDLDYALSIDADDNGAIDWGELRRRYPEWSTYVLGHLELSKDGLPCVLHAQDLLVDEHSDGHYAVLRFAARCSAAGGNLQVRYRLFFDIDPQHRGLLRLEQGGRIDTAVLSPEAPAFDAGSGAESERWRGFLDYAREGVWHIWIGYDHILFLLSLLLPAVLVRRAGAWQAVTNLRPALVDVAKIVTAFTLAHSVTLSLAALGYLDLPSRWVESAIALSVVLAAANNLYPRWYEYRTAVAFGFGLIHGLGFASVLADLSLPQGSLITALIGFNLGVEFGQLAIVCAFLPTALLLSRSHWYVPLALQAGSMGIAGMAGVWLLERSLGP